MLKIKEHKKERLTPKIRRAIILGVIVLVIAGAVLGFMEFNTMNGKAKASMDKLKQQCISFERILLSDKTKSLFRMTDLLQHISTHIGEDGPVTDEFLENYVDSLRMSGIAVLNEELKLEASGYTREFRDSNWEEGQFGKYFADVCKYDNKVFAERIEDDGEFYDVCAVPRKDKKGIVIGFYKQPSGLVSSNQNDLESILSDLHLESDGEFAIAKDGVVHAASNKKLNGLEEESNDLLKNISAIPKDGKLHFVPGNGRSYAGYRSACEGYVIYLYYPVSAMLIPWLAKVGVILIIYLLACFAYFASRNKYLYENQKMLEESNRQLTETVRMLESLETIYYSIFYVDLTANSYINLFVAPWLEDKINEEGVYTELKKFLIDNVVVEKYRETVDERMSIDFLREKLTKSNINDFCKSVHTDYQVIRDGEIKWSRVGATVVDYDSDGHPVHILGLLQDIDEEKKKEEEYQNRILKEARDAKIANNAKTNFLRRISHDIRTPINGVQGYIDMGRRNPDDKELQEHCRENASQALHSLLELVNSILELSKLEGSEVLPERKSFDITELLGEINVVLKPLAQEKGLDYMAVNGAELPEKHLIGSPRHLSQVLMNLINNSIKFGRAGGYVKLNCKTVECKSDYVVYEFICEDNGMGMSKEFQEHLFEPFAQEYSNSARTHYEGSGLGLAIVKKIMDTMGGTVICYSEKGVGTTFKVQLRFDVDKGYMDTEAIEKHSVSKPLEGVSVLLVEDNELNMEISEYLLEENGAKVSRAWNGKEAVEKFKESELNYYDLIIMDVMMPEMNGIDATKAIRKLDRTDAKTIKICAMSANAFKDDVRACLKAGMNQHLAKPVEEDTLIEMARKLLHFSE